MEYLKYLSSIISNIARCTWEIVSCIAMTKAAFKNKNSFQHQITLKFLENK